MRSENEINYKKCGEFFGSRSGYYET